MFVTPLVDKARKPDNFQPRVCITKAFKDGEISLENRQAIQNFALALACEEKHAVNYKRYGDRKGEEVKRKGSSQSNK